MAVRELIVDPTCIDCDEIVADIEAIREFLPQRGPLEQLTAIVLDDLDRQICVGYKDVAADDFWVSGHMPGKPLMPGVLMCESAAQVFSYYVQRHDLSGAPVVGFGGMDKVRFCGMVHPGDRLIVACQLTKVRRGRVMQCHFQNFVRESLVCEGELVGVPLSVDVIHPYEVTMHRVVPSHDGATR